MGQHIRWSDLHTMMASLEGNLRVSIAVAIREEVNRHYIDPQVRDCLEGLANRIEFGPIEFAKIEEESDGSV